MGSATASAAGSAPPASAIETSLFSRLPYDAAMPPAMEAALQTLELSDIFGSAKTIDLIGELQLSSGGVFQGWFGVVL